MPTTTKTRKVECLNPNTGRKMLIDESTYGLFSKAIYHTLKKEGALTFTQLAKGVADCLRQQQTNFEGSVGWYTVSVKNDLQAKGVIEAFTEKGRKLNRLKK